MVSIVKHSGEREEFDTEKVRFALIRSGASEELADELVGEVGSRVVDGMSTGEVYRIAFRLLKKRDTPSATRFGLKLAIMRLGPSGFPFEKYVSRVLAEHGYKTSNNLILKGVCVEHEVDLVAERDGERYMVECKYHNQRGISTGLKEALYTQARYEDLVEGGHDFTCPWIITNTKASLEAKKYGKCKNMKLTTWGYPPDCSLQDLIECECLYPVTILRRVTGDIMERLVDRGLIIVQDLEKLTPQELSEATNLRDQRLDRLIQELGEIATHPNYERTRKIR